MRKLYSAAIVVDCSLVPISVFLILAERLSGRPTDSASVLNFCLLLFCFVSSWLRIRGGNFCFSLFGGGAREQGGGKENCVVEKYELFLPLLLPFHFSFILPITVPVHRKTLSLTSRQHNFHLSFYSFSLPREYKKSLE